MSQTRVWHHRQGGEQMLQHSAFVRGNFLRNQGTNERSPSRQPLHHSDHTSYQHTHGVHELYPGVPDTNNGSRRAYVNFHGKEEYIWTNQRWQTGNSGDDKKMVRCAENNNGFSREMDPKRPIYAHQDMRDTTLTSHQRQPAESSDPSFVNYDSGDEGWLSNELKITSTFSLSPDLPSKLLHDEHADLKEVSSRSNNVDQIVHNFEPEAESKTRSFRYESPAVVLHQEAETLFSRKVSVSSSNRSNKEDKYFDITEAQFQDASYSFTGTEESKFTQECNLADRRHILQTSVQRNQSNILPLKRGYNPYPGNPIPHRQHLPQLTRQIPGSSPLQQDPLATQRIYTAPKKEELEKERMDFATFVKSEGHGSYSPAEFYKVTSPKKQVLPVGVYTRFSSATSEPPFGNNESPKFRSVGQTRRFPSPTQPQDVLGRPSVCFAKIRKTNESQTTDEHIVLDMMTRGMPSSLSTTSACHQLPIVCSSTEQKDQTSSDIQRKRLVDYQGKIGLPSQLQKLSSESFHKFKMTTETRQQSHIRYHTPTVTVHHGPQSIAGGLTSFDNDNKGTTRPSKGSKTNLFNNVSPVKLLITPAPMPFRDLELDSVLGEDDMEPIVKMPNYFLDFASESSQHGGLVRNSQLSKSYPAVYTPHNPAADISPKMAERGDACRGETRANFTSSQGNEAANNKVLQGAGQPLKKRVLSFEAQKQQKESFPLVCKAEPNPVEGQQAFASTADKRTTPNQVKALEEHFFPTAYAEEITMKKVSEKCSSNPSNIVDRLPSSQSSLSPTSSGCKRKSQSTFEKVFGLSHTRNGICVTDCNTNAPRAGGSKGATSQKLDDDDDLDGLQFERRYETASVEKSIVPSLSIETVPWNEDQPISPRENGVKPNETSFRQTVIKESLSADKLSLLTNDDSAYNGSSDSEVCSTHTEDSGDSSTLLHSFQSLERKYKCVVCGRAFSRSNTLTTHTRIHTGDRPFTCDVCGRAFRQLGNLTRHKLTHADIKPHACPKCSKCFSRTSNLHTHMRTHTNYKPFVCEFCGKGFHQKVDMKIHRYTHTGEKPHKCNKCGRGFKQLTHLKYHTRTHSDVRMYKCEYCGKGFNQKGNLQAHIYGHTGTRPYKCDICGKGFTLTSTLNTHKRTHAPTKPFQCDFCDKAFYQKNALKTHYISSHPYTDGVCLL